MASGVRFLAHIFVIRQFDSNTNVIGHFESKMAAIGSYNNMMNFNGMDGVNGKKLLLSYCNFIIC